MNLIKFRCKWVWCYAQFSRTFQICILVFSLVPNSPQLETSNCMFTGVYSSSLTPRLHCFPWVIGTCSPFQLRPFNLWLALGWLGHRVGEATLSWLNIQKILSIDYQQTTPTPLICHRLYCKLKSVWCEVE